MGLPGGWWCGTAGGATGRVVGRGRRTGPRGGAVVGVIGGGGGGADVPAARKCPCTLFFI